MSSCLHQTCHPNGHDPGFDLLYALSSAVTPFCGFTSRVFARTSPSIRCLLASTPFVATFCMLLTSDHAVGACPSAVLFTAGPGGLYVLLFAIGLCPARGGI